MACQSGLITACSLHQLQRLNWVILVFLALAALLLVSAPAAQGVVVGGLVANLSFYFLKKDLLHIMQGPLNFAKVRFFIKYYARLTVLAAILFLLIKNRSVHLFGLLAGLSTVVLSIWLLVAGAAGRLYITAKEAS